MKNDGVNWALIGCMIVSEYFSLSPPASLFWFSYVFFCLFGIFLLLLGKRTGYLTHKGLIIGILVCLIVCALLYVFHVDLRIFKS